MIWSSLYELKRQGTVQPIEQLLYKQREPGAILKSYQKYKLLLLQVNCEPIVEKLINMYNFNFVIH